VVRYVITVLALIALIYVAGTALIGGGINFLGGAPFRYERHSQVERLDITLLRRSDAGLLRAA